MASPSTATSTLSSPIKAKTSFSPSSQARLQGRAEPHTSSLPTKVYCRRCLAASEQANLAAAGSQPGTHATRRHTSIYRILGPLLAAVSPHPRKLRIRRLASAVLCSLRFCLAYRSGTGMFPHQSLLFLIQRLHWLNPATISQQSLPSAVEAHSLRLRWRRTCTALQSDPFLLH